MRVNPLLTSPAEKLEAKDRGARKVMMKKMMRSEENDEEEEKEAEEEET